MAATISETPEVHHSLTNHLGWNPALQKLFGQSTLLRDIEVCVDFDWEQLIGHPQRTFTNYMSLGEYVRRQPASDKKRALILTEQSRRAEGCISDHPLYEIFVVNVLRYKEVARNDPAGAYFMGLQGAPVIRAGDIDARNFGSEGIASILNALATDEALAEWVRRHPSELASIVASMNHLIPLTQTTLLIEEIGRRLPTMDPDDILHLQAIMRAVDFPSNLLRSVNLAQRKHVVDEFRAKLNGSLWGEKDWQKFFEDEAWIFGHGLLYQFLHIVERETNVGGKNMSNTGGQIADFSMRTIGDSASFIALVDIKTPLAKLVKPDPCRNAAHAIHSDLAEAVAQILSNCDSWTREGSGQHDNVRRAAKEGWQTAQPRGILVLGHSSTLGSDDAKQSFELFRRHLHGVEIITFDELLRRADAMASPHERPNTKSTPLNVDGGVAK